jgi:hypothetical protein
MHGISIMKLTVFYFTNLKVSAFCCKFLSVQKKKKAWCEVMTSVDKKTEPKKG